MSGVIKGIKKAFKKVWKGVKKIIKPLAIAAAIYFTAGVAASYFAPGMAAAMPGFGAGGMFSRAAAAIGFNGAAGSGIAQTAAGIGSSVAGATGSAVAGSAAPAAGATPGWGGLVDAAANGAPAATSAIASTAAKGTMSAFEKMMLLKTGVDLVSGLLAPKKDGDFPLANQAWGRDAKGNGRGLQIDYNRESGEFEQAAAETAPAEVQPASVSASTPQDRPGEPKFAQVENRSPGMFELPQAKLPDFMPEQGAVDFMGENEAAKRVAEGYRRRDYGGMA